MENIGEETSSIETILAPSQGIEPYRLVYPAASPGVIQCPSVKPGLWNRLTITNTNRTNRTNNTDSMNQPNATLYIKNIDWKIKKGLLKRALYTIFSRHGKVVEIVALRKQGLRGQAFVVMDDVQAATAALQAEQGFSFFGKDMVIEYAKTKSDRIAKRDGDYVPKAKRQKMQAEQQQQQQEEAAEGTAETAEMEKPEEEEAEAPAAAEGTSNDATTTTPVAAAPEQVVVADAPPSKILLAQRLPTECNEMMLGMLFQQYAGYKEVL